MALLLGLFVGGPVVVVILVCVPGKALPSWTGPARVIARNAAELALWGICVWAWWVASGSKDPQTEREVLAEWILAVLCFLGPPFLITQFRRWFPLPPRV